MNKQKKNRNKGFSLVELIVVIAIMAILVGVAVPVYTSYIEKSQEAKDIQLVDEVKHAVEIAAAAENWAGQLPAGTEQAYIGSVVIKSNGTSYITPGENGVEMPVTAALTATFGDLSKLTLSYGGWKGPLNEGDAAVAVGSSSFNGKTQYLMQDIQALTNAVKDFAAGKSEDEDIARLFNTYLDPETIRDLGFDPDDPQEVANATTFFIAKKTSETPVDTFINGWRTGNFNLSLSDMLVGMAAQFAATDAMVCYSGCQELRNSFVVEIDTTDRYSIQSSLTEMTNKLQSHIMGPEDNGPFCEKCLLAIYGLDSNRNPVEGAGYMNSPNAENDAKAYYAMMKQILQSKDMVSSDKKDASMFDKGSLSSYVNHYLSVASLVGTSAQDGDVVIVFTINKNGAISSNAYPIDY